MDSSRLPTAAPMSRPPTGPRSTAGHASVSAHRTHAMPPTPHPVRPRTLRATQLTADALRMLTPWR